MTEENNKDRYIICSNCKCKYINDEEHISKDFGYTRLEERYKTCVKCRARGKIEGKKYYDKHKEELNEYCRKYREEHKEYDKQYRERNADRLKEYDRVRDQIRNLKVKCPNCDIEVCGKYLSRHQKTKKCQAHNPNN
jgi:hypothetical protein